MTRTALMSCVAFATLATASPALGQDTSAAAPLQQTGDQPPPAAATSDSAIQDIVVTAERREQSIQKAPIAITAIGSEQIEDRGITSVEQVQQIAPGLVFNQQAGVTQLYIRGIGLDQAAISGEPGIALHVDGVYMARATVAGATYTDLDRIEVLRGPQGTLYGRNATGGAVNIITKTPGRDLSGEAQVTVGTFGRFAGAAALEGALDKSGDVRARISFAGEHRGGYRRNLFTGNRVDNLRAFSTRGTLVTEFDPSFKVTWRGDYSRQSSNGPAYTTFAEIPIIDPASGNFGSVPSAPGGIFQDQLNLTPTLPVPTNRDVVNDAKSDLFNRQGGGSATAEFSPVGGNFTLRSITAYRETRFGVSADVDGTSAAILDNTSNRERTKQFTQEFNFLGELPAGTQYILGAFYLRERAQDDDQFVFGSLPRIIERATEIGTGAPIGSLAGTVPGNLRFQVLQKTRSYAGFAQVTQPLGDKLKLIAGARYTKDKKDFDQSLVAFGGTLCDQKGLKNSWESVTWRAGLTYQADNATLVYGNASTGFKAGGFNLGACNNSYDPEKVTSFDAGLKTTILDGRVRFNVAGFYYDYKDLQATRFTSTGATIENASGATLYGGEIEMQTRLVPRLTVDGSISLLHAEYGTFVTVDPFRPLLGSNDVKGNRVTRSPKFTGSATVAYTLPIGDGGLTAQYEVYRTTSVYFNVQNTPDALQKAYTLQNARLIWNLGKYQVGAFVENLTDKIYALSKVPTSSSGTTSGQLAAPRTYGVTAGLKF